MAKQLDGSQISQFPFYFSFIPARAINVTLPPFDESASIFSHTVGRATRITTTS